MLAKQNNGFTSTNGFRCWFTTYVLSTCFHVPRNMFLTVHSKSLLLIYHSPFPTCSLQYISDSHAPNLWHHTSLPSTIMSLTGMATQPQVTCIERFVERKYRVSNFGHIYDLHLCLFYSWIAASCKSYFLRRNARCHYLSQYLFWKRPWLQTMSATSRSRSPT